MTVPTVADEAAVHTSRTPLPPMPGSALITFAAPAVGLGALTTAVMLCLVTSGLTGEQLATARFDAVKIGLSVAVTVGGLFAFLLAWRRQRSTEADLDNRERVFAH